MCNKKMLIWRRAYLIFRRCYASVRHLFNITSIVVAVVVVVVVAAAAAATAVWPLSANNFKIT